MGTIALRLDVSSEVYDALIEAARKEKKSPEELSAEILLAFLERQRKLAEGRQLLRTMPQRAAARGRHPRRTHTARQHDDYLYGEEA